MGVGRRLVASLAALLMAIAYVGGQAGGRANPSSALSVNFALSGGLASVPAAGDLVIVTCVTGSANGNPAMAVVTPTGYAALGQLTQNATADTSMDVSYKFMGGTPDTAVTIPGTTNNAWGEAYTIQVFRGVDPTTPMDVTPVSAGGTGTGQPDPGSIDWVTAGAWVTIHGGGAAATSALYTPPTGYATNAVGNRGQDTTDAMVGSGYRTDPADPENPGTFGGGTTGAGDSWCAYTLALRPAATVAEGDLAATEAADTAAVSGDVIVEGTFAAAEAADVAALSGDVIVAGDLAATEAQDVLAASGTVEDAVPVTGDLAATEAADALAVSGDVLVAGDLAATEAPDTFASDGEVSWEPVTGDLAAAEAADALAATGDVLVTGDVAATEAADALAGSGAVLVAGDLVSTEAQDVAALAGDVIVAGELSASEGADAAAIAGQVFVAGTLAATEAPDVVLITSETIATGNLAAVEAPDTLAASGVVLVDGVLVAAEAADAAALAGDVLVAAAFALVEAADVALASGDVLVSGVLDVTEAPDVFVATNEPRYGPAARPGARFRTRLAGSGNTHLPGSSNRTRLVN